MISIKSIPHNEQRYDTVGDWKIVPKENNKIDMEITVSETGNDDYTFLIAVHEMIEAYLCLRAEITQEQVDDFDMQFERLRAENTELIGEQEPGDMISAPYHKQHVFATSIERQVAAQLGIDWKKYEDKLSNL